MLTIFRVQLQLEEALGETNRYFCNRMCNRDVHEEEHLIRYYIESGGAADFARRWEVAMGHENRWFCSEFYLREVNDPCLLWHYFMHYVPLRASGKISRFQPPQDANDRAIAC